MALMFRLVLILSLVAASALMAPMRGQMAGVSQIEICSDDGVEVLVLDAAGNPVAAHPPCPDCLACGAIGPLAEQRGLVLAQAVLPLAHPLPRAVAAAGRLAIQPAARDSPRPV